MIYIINDYYTSIKNGIGSFVNELKIKSRKVYESTYDIKYMKNKYTFFLNNIFVS